MIGSHRRATMARAALALAAALACSPEPDRPVVPADGRPNLLLVTVDTLRADHLGIYGFGFDTSPRIDALAREGAVFERAIAGASATAPSHASILTSRYTRQHSIGYKNGDTRLVGARSLAQVLRAAGYDTGAFVGNAVLQRRTGLARGFQVYDDELPSRERNRFVFERVADDTTFRALAWLGSRGGEPFLLWVHYQDPHGPYQPPPGHADRVEIPGAADEEPLPALENQSGLGGIPLYQVLPGVRRPSRYRSLYAGEIHYADAAIGRLVEAVDAASARSGRPAIVLLTADHGESFGENGRWFVHFYTSTPENAHVPFVLRAPGIAPQRRREVVHHVDILPTLLDLAGIPPPRRTSGVSLAPLLREGRPLPKRFVYCDAGRELSAYRGEGFFRVVGALSAWEGDAEDAPDDAGEGPADAEDAPDDARPGGKPAPLRGARYAWPADGPWERQGGVSRPPPPVVRYARRAVPMRDARPADAATRERLRALGYVGE